MNYRWQDDIIDVIESYDIPNDTKDDLLYRAAERIVEDDNGLDYYDGDRDSAIMEEMGNIIGLFAVPLDSALYDLLVEWYEDDEELLLERVRDAFTDDENLYFVTGAQYMLYDADLLGGDGNGETQKKFEEFVRNR